MPLHVCAIDSSLSLPADLELQSLKLNYQSFLIKRGNSNELNIIYLVQGSFHSIVCKNNTSFSPGIHELFFTLSPKEGSNKFDRSFEIHLHLCHT